MVTKSATLITAGAFLAVTWPAIGHGERDSAHLPTKGINYFAPAVGSSTVTSAGLQLCNAIADAVQTAPPDTDVLKGERTIWPSA
jgi:hypothetical protein